MGKTGENSSPGHRLLMRGESMIASTGLALAGILVVVTVLAGIWTAMSQRQALLAARHDAVRAKGEMLAAASERGLTQGDLSAVRALLMTAAQGADLEACRVTLADGGVLADATSPAKADVQSVPERIGGAAGEVEETLSEGSIAMRFPLRVGDRGFAVLELSAGVMYPFWSNWEAQAGLGVIGAAGMAALLLVYRRMRHRMRALGAIREALLDLGRGETGHAALAVSAEFGAEASAWNALLAERETLKRDLVAERARESLGARRDAQIDLVQACDAMWQGLIVVDDKLRAKYANGAAAVFLRAKRDEITGADVSKFIGDPQVVEAVRTVADGSVRRRTTIELRRTDEDGSGGGILRFSVRPVRRDDSAAAIIMIEDVTQQRVADEARNAFVAQATHELRTPLTNIRLYVEQAVDEGENDPKLRAKCLNVINQESRRLERIVGDMLSVAEIEAGSLKLRAGDVRLETLFEELEADFQGQAKDKNLTLRFQMPPKLPVMRGDRDKIVLALHNLVGNAIKYTPTGGEVQVKIDADEEKLTVAVSDTGIGISEEETELVFEKFYRAKDKRVSGITGSGLGLALAREVVRLHGGDITVRSQVDQGSTFTMTVPTTVAA